MRKFKLEMDELQPDPSKKVGGKNRQRFDHAQQKFYWFSVRLKQLGTIRDTIGLAFGEINSSQAIRKITTMLTGKEEPQLRAYVAGGWAGSSIAIPSARSSGAFPGKKSRLSGSQ